MKRNILLIILTALVIASCGDKSRPLSSDKKEPLPKDVQLIRHTPVKEQGNSSLCWAYSMLATIESEHIMKGDSINLSIAYIARMMLHEKAYEYYLSKGKKGINMRGMGSTLIYYMEKYGAEPYDSYEDPKNINYKVLCRKVEQICNNALAKKAGLDKLHEQLDELLDQEIGIRAKIVHMLGAEYTPLEFAHSVCYPEEYVSLTSFTHHPFREYFALEVPDNQQHDSFLNLPIDELVAHIQKAIERGHPVCWEGDITEPGFTDNPSSYVDIQPSQRPVTQKSRQREFEQLLTTDDHTMEIIGMFRHGKQNYYVCKNSWGKQWKSNGLVYLSEDYIRLKTIAVFMSEDAFVPDHPQDT